MDNANVPAIVEDFRRARRKANFQSVLAQLTGAASTLRGSPGGKKDGEA